MSDESTPCEYDPFDQACMDRALELASLGRGHVEPNPMVGCVVARDGKIIAEGFHQRFGEHHAEVNALHACPNPRGATLYVTLEPCSHHGKTPPCADAIVKAGIQRVVIAARDPFPQVNGDGMQRLTAAGLTVDVGLRAAQAKQLNAPFRKLVQTGRPWVIAKWAMTIDGKLASRTRQSKWISGEAARQRVHELRGNVDAIAVGIGTVEADDPMLTARPAGARVPLRVVIDSKARLLPSSRIATTADEVPTLVAVSSDVSRQDCSTLVDLGCEVFRCQGDSRGDQLSSLLVELGCRNLTNLLVEGGAGVMGTLLEIDQVDEIQAFIAPKLLGGADGTVLRSADWVSPIPRSRPV